MSQKAGRMLSLRKSFGKIVLLSLFSGIYASLMIVGWAWIDPGNGYDFVIDMQSAAFWLALVLPVVILTFFVIFVISWGTAIALVRRWFSGEDDRRMDRRLAMPVGIIGYSVAGGLIILALGLLGVRGNEFLAVLPYVTAVVLLGHLSTNLARRMNS